MSRDNTLAQERRSENQKEHEARHGKTKMFKRGKGAHLYLARGGEPRRRGGFRATCSAKRHFWPGEA